MIQIKHSSGRVYTCEQESEGRRILTFLENNNIRSPADVDTWAAANITSVAQARNAIAELIKFVILRSRT